LGRLTVAAATVLGVASLVVAPSWVRASPSGGTGQPCARGYGYAGYASTHGVEGVAATITALRQPQVASGHAAAWVGVGGIRAGRGGASEWLQAGIAAFPHLGLRLYVESVSRERRFIDLGHAVAGRRYRVRVAEVRQDLWQATIDGRAVGEPAELPTAHGSWRAVATAETWTAGRAVCNSYAYRFESVSVLSSTRWNTLSGAEHVGGRVDGGHAAFSAAA
jgi:hypothetical protein